MSSPEDLKELFQKHIYGFLPQGKTVGTDTRQINDDTFEISIHTKNPQKTLNLFLALPKGAKKSPVFLVLNSHGNHTVNMDETLRVSESWINRAPLGQPAITSAHAPRGYHAARFPVDYILSQGYGFATLHESDAAPDDATQSHETIAHWAWALMRSIDALAQTPRVDVNKIGVTGHSRRGKAALLAAAFDARIALCIPHQSGTGGAANSRKTEGETVRQINDRFPHWFCDTFKNYNDNEDALPVDQHQLLGLVAPRPLLVTNAQDDRWADPDGTWETVKMANSAYHTLKGKNDLTGSLGWHIRAGDHSIGLEDWKTFIAFANIHLRD